MNGILSFPFFFFMVPVLRSPNGQRGMARICICLCCCIWKQFHPPLPTVLQEHFATLSALSISNHRFASMCCTMLLLRTNKHVKNDRRNEQCRAPAVNGGPLFVQVPTAYDRSGRCRQYRGPPRPEDPMSEASLGFAVQVVICWNPRPAKESKEGKSIPTQMLEKAEAHGNLMGHLRGRSVYLWTRFCSYTIL